MFENMNIRAKLVLVISSIVVVITAVISVVFIYRSSSEMKASLIKKGVLLAKSIGSLSANYIAGFQFFEVQRAIEDSVVNDKEIVYGILEDNKDERILAKDEILEMSGGKEVKYKVVSLIPPDSYGITEKGIKIREVNYGNEDIIEILMTIEISPEVNYFLKLGFTTKYLVQSVVSNILISVLVVILFILLGIIFTLFFARSFSRPILQLKDAAIEFGKKNFDYQIKISSKDEIGILAQTFDEMRRSIKEYSEHLEELVRQRTKELEEAYEKLKEKDRIIQMELDFASRIQKGIMPNSGYKWRDYTIIGFSQPMEKIGGDFFDIFPIPGNKLLFYVADVSGHGIPAALITTMLKISVLNIAFETQEPHEIIESLNKRLRIINYNMYSQFMANYLTIFLGVLEKESTMSYSIGGHHLPILYRSATETFETIKETEGSIVGILDDNLYIASTESFELMEGDRLIVYTDGIVERRNLKGEELGLERFKEMILEGHRQGFSGKRFLSFLLSKIEDFAEGVPPKDDYTLLVIEKKIS